jgi:two-component system nitrogen regulation response regulator GlnG
MEDRNREDDIERIVMSSSSGDLYSRVIGSAEKTLIEKALKRAFGNQSIAARILGINRNTLRTKIRKLNIDVSEFKI